MAKTHSPRKLPSLSPKNSPRKSPRTSPRKQVKKASPKKSPRNSPKKSPRRSPRKSSSSSSASPQRRASNGADFNNNPAAYWDIIAKDYTSEIVSSYDADKSNRIVKYINKFADKKGVVGDFGCGVGKYLRALAPRFKTVRAMDFSAGLLEQADKAVNSLPKHNATITLAQADLTKPEQCAAALHGDKPKFGICMNVLLSPQVDIQKKILKTVYNALDNDAHLLLLVPSIECDALMNWIELEGPLSKKNGEREEYLKNALRSSKLDRCCGVVDLDTVRTQHYCQEQIRYYCAEAGFEVLETTKSEYEWSTILDGATPKEKEERKRLLKGIQGPWDWLLLLHKK